MDPLDPKNQATPPGQATTEYKVALWTALGTLGGTFLLAALVLVALIVGRIDLQASLILLGFLLVPGAPSAAYVARGYSADRTGLKAEVAKGAAQVAAAEGKAGVAPPVSP